LYIAGCGSLDWDLLLDDGHGISAPRNIPLNMDRGSHWVIIFNLPQLRQLCLRLWDLLVRINLSLTRLVTKVSIEIGKLISTASVGIFENWNVAIL
jgi:hypothetical protein